MFNAVLLTQSDGKTHAAVAALDDDALPPDGDVLVAIDYSTVNYKDGLAITGKAPVVRSWPMVAGIDGAGTVLASKHAAWRPGERVVLNGYGVGETHWGCLAQKARLRGDWLVKLPERFSSRDAMIIGTAGYTAMLSVMALERSGVVPHHGDVLVTGANRGLGFETSRQLLAKGLTVVLAGRDRTSLERARRSLTRHEQERAVIVPMDVTSVESIDAAHRTVVEHVGAVGVVVNNAAVLLGENDDVLSISPDGYRRTFDTNVFGAIEVCRAFVPAMVRAGSKSQ